MKFAPMNYHYLRYPIKKFLDKVERSPFDSIDLYCSAPQLNLFDYPLLRLIELKKEIEAHHLSVMAMTPENCVYPVNFCTQDDLTRESSIRYYQRAIDTAQFLDCPCVQISTGFGYFDQPREEGWKYCRESLWTLAQYCEKKGVRLLLEELKVTTTNVLITSKVIAKMLEEIESPSIVGMVDMDQMTYAKETIDDYFDNLGDKLQHKLFDLSVSDTHYAYTVNADYKNAIATALGLSKEATSEQLYNKLAEYKENPSGIQKFANDFTAAALKAGTAETGTSGKITSAEKSYTFNNLAYGYYLVYQTGTKEIQSSLVSVDKDSKTITLKGKAPSIEKEADKTTVEIGQVVTYTITGTIPDTTGYAQYTYKIHDTLTEGLDFVEDTMGKLPTEKKYEVSVQIEGEQDSVIKEADIDPDNARKMTLDLSQWIRENQTHKGKTFTVTYYAKVNADAVVQTNNSAHLEYGNDPDNITTTTPDVVTTPTYPVQIHKLIKDQQNSYLAGAIFRLYRSEEDANNNQNAIAVTGSNGTYTVDPVQVGDNKMYDMESIGDGTTVGTGMNLKLNGLAEGSYWLVETQAPDGYNKLTAPVKITITKSDTTNVDDWTIKQNDGVVDDKIIDIENTTGTLLPETGGMGTVIFTVIAVVMILGIAVSFVISRRKRA